MARIDDLMARISDPVLRREIETAVAALKKTAPLWVGL